MASFRVPLTVGGKIVRHHQMWPTWLRADLVTFMAANHPGDDVGHLWRPNIALEQLLALSWRVRRWRLTGTFSVVAGNNSIPPGSQASMAGAIVAADIQIFRSDNTPIQNEVELIRSAAPVPRIWATPRNGGIGTFNPVSFTFSAKDDFDPFFPPQSGTNTMPEGIAIFRNGQIGYDAVIWDPTTKKFNPYLTVTLGGANILFYGVNVCPPSKTSNGTLTITPGVAPAFTVPLLSSGTYNPGGSPPSGNFSSGGATLALAAVKFWPYVNRLGDPVYNEDTGAQINDPNA